MFFVPLRFSVSIQFSMCGALLRNRESARDAAKRCRIRTLANIDALRDASSAVALMYATALSSSALK